MLARKQLAGAAEAGDHLVGDQQRADLAAAPAQCGQEAVARDAHAALALHRLDDHRGHRVVDARQRRRVIERQELDAGQQRLEGLPIDRVAADGQRPEGVAVERAVEGHETRAAGELARRLQRAFHRLGAAVGEVDDVEVARRQRGQPLRQLHLRRLHHLAVHRHVQVPPDLLLNGRDDRRMRVPDIGDAHARQQVEVLATRRIPDRRPTRPLDHETQRLRRCLADVAQEGRSVSVVI